MFSNLPRIHPEWHNKALLELRNIYQALQNDEFSWLESDTIRLCIVPTLQLLRFPERSIRQPVKRARHEDGSGLDPDLLIEIYGSGLGVLEAKKAFSDLTARHGYKDSWSPIDQTLRYFDSFGLRYAILTNGLEWIVFRNAVTNPNYEYIYQYEAIRTNLYDIIFNNDADMLDKFLIHFNYYAINSNEWPDVRSKFKKHVTFPRIIDDAIVMMYDFSYDNKYR